MKSRYEWVKGQYAKLTKSRLVDMYIRYMLARTQQMFKYNNLPNTIPQKDLELLLQVGGNVTITKVDDKLYAFNGNLGGEYNEYYHPTLSIISNPYLKYNASLKINEDCAVILNDSMYTGLMPLFNKYATLYADAILSLRASLVNTRINKFISTDDDNAKESVKKMLRDIDEGDNYDCVIGTNTFFKGILTHDYQISNTHIKDIIESINYIESSWYMDLGLPSNWNNKRESLNESEIATDELQLLPLIDDMLEMRKIGVDRVNKMYGTNISVELNSAWQLNRDNVNKGGDYDVD